MSERLDPRRNAYRDDLADAALRGRVSAPRYVTGERRQVIEPDAPLRRAPRFDAPLETEALHGEVVRVFDEREGWAWVQLERDRYVGYMPVDALARDVTPPTHWVRALRTFVYPAPDIKTSPLSALSLAAAVAVREMGERFAQIASGGFVFAAHLAPLSEPAADFVAVAERFVGVPYLWGGRTSLGVDCSGLVQLALQAAGIDAPRDTDMQQAELGAPVEPALDRLQRGDLVFWSGHVAIMLDGGRLLHANAHHMATVVEPAAEAVARIAASHAHITGARRL